MVEGKKRGGGPKTAEGRGRSSRNSTQHGLRATKIVLLPDESQEEYDEMVAGWRNQFLPADYQEEKLVETLILNDWLHRRALRRLLSVEAAVVGADGLDPTQWTSERRHRMELAERYKNSTERAFHKAWSVLPGLRKDLMRLQDQKSRLKLQLDIFKLNKASEKAIQRRAKKRGEERVQPPKAILFYQEGLEGKVMREEWVDGKVVEKEVLVEEDELS
jgi:hypothetical protein